MGLKDKAAKIDFASLPDANPPSLPTGLPLSGQNFVASRPKTAPGALMAATAERRAGLERENEALRGELRALEGVAEQAQALRDELKAWDGAKATRLMDPRLISRSRWANRDPRHFETSEFEVLKAEILSAGGNIQPIKVRPIPSAEDGQPCYELVFGHRRHEACRQLGLPVLAVVENLGDAALFVEMDRENRARKDLSAWEQGVMYRRALDDGLFSSSRKLAEAVGADLSQVGKALSLASLPEALVAAFESPLDLQFRWAKPLKDAWDADPQAMNSRAQELARREPRRKPKEIFDRLVGAELKGGGTVPPPAPIEVSIGGRRGGTVALTARGSAVVTVEPGLVPAKRLKELAQLIERFLASDKGQMR